MVGTNPQLPEPVMIVEMLGHAAVTNNMARHVAGVLEKHYLATMDQSGEPPKIFHLPVNLQRDGFSCGYYGVYHWGILHRARDQEDFDLREWIVANPPDGWHQLLWYLLLLRDTMAEHRKPPKGQDGEQLEWDKDDVTSQMLELGVAGKYGDPLVPHMESLVNDGAWKRRIEGMHPVAIPLEKMLKHVYDSYTAFRKEKTTTGSTPTG